MAQFFDIQIPGLERVAEILARADHCMQQCSKRLERSRQLESISVDLCCKSDEAMIRARGWLERHQERENSN
jgi:hypothetical protein